MASDKLSAVRAELAALASTRKTKQDAAAEAAELRRLEQQLVDSKAIVEAEQKLGEQGVDFGCVTAPNGCVIILKRPEYAAYREFQDTADTKSSHLESMCEACRFHPEFAAYDKLQERFPGLLTVCAAVLAKLAGSRATEDAKK